MAGLAKDCPARTRSVLTNCSANEFACGDQTGVLITRMPFPEKTSSNAVVNLLSLSRVRNLCSLRRPPPVILWMDMAAPYAGG